MPSAPNAIRPSAKRPVARRDSTATKRSRSTCRTRRSSRRALLGGYTDEHGRAREIVAQPGPADSTLVVDRDASSGEDCRLVAHLAADEPCGNAALVCSHYLSDEPGTRGRCRRVTVEDTSAVAHAQHVSLGSGHLGRTELRLSEQQWTSDPHGNGYRLELLPSKMSIPQLRWLVRGSGGDLEQAEPVSVREVVAALEDYEPVCTLTQLALACHEGDVDVSTATLRAELTRLRESPIVLNRALRQAVLAAAETDQLSMSEIATRCGRVKRDGKGNESGETSWLARRIGLLAEGGRDRATPWIHSDVLALIARRGLGLAPREVELT